MSVEAIIILLLVGVILLFVFGNKKFPHAKTEPEAEKNHPIRKNRLNYSDWSLLNGDRKLELFQDRFKNKDFSYHIDIDYSYYNGSDERSLKAGVSRTLSSFLPRELGAMQLLELIDEAGLLDEYFPRDWAWRSFYAPLIWGDGKADINHITYKFTHDAIRSLSGADSRGKINYALEELYRTNTEQAITRIYDTLQTILNDPEKASNPFIQRAAALYKGKPVMTPSALSGNRMSGIVIGGKF